MSVNQVYIVDDLKQKIQKLADRLEEQKATNNKLLGENQGLSDKLNEQEKEIQNLKQLNNTLKLSKAFTSENGESQEARLQITKIVREIDKCIALLNK